MTQFKFKRDVLRLFASFGLTPEAIHEEQPHSDLLHRFPRLPDYSPSS